MARVDEGRNLQLCKHTWRDNTQEIIYTRSDKKERLHVETMWVLMVPKDVRNDGAYTKYMMPVTPSDISQYFAVSSLLTIMQYDCSQWSWRVEFHSMYPGLVCTSTCDGHNHNLGQCVGHEGGECHWVEITRKVTAEQLRHWRLRTTAQKRVSWISHRSTSLERKGHTWYWLE